MLRIALPIVLTVLTGAGIVLQQALNTRLRTELDSAGWSGLTNFVVGAVCMIALIIALGDPTPTAGDVARIPWWTWGGGVFGALFIAMGIFMVPQIGAAAFIAFLFTGQMLASVIFDHYGWLGLAQRPVDAPRLIGVALLIGGVILVRR